MFDNGTSQEHYSDETYQAVMDCLSPEARIVALGDGVLELQAVTAQASLIVDCKPNVRLVVALGGIVLPLELSRVIKADARLA